MPVEPVAVSDLPVMILTGPPGAGKSTAMRTFRHSFPGLDHFGVRVFFQRQIELGTPLGVRAAVFHESRVWHPDEMILEGIALWLDQTLPDATRIVFESFPRNASQARAVDGLLAERGLRVNRVVSLDVPDEICAARVTGREVCVECDTIVADAIPVPGSACPHCGRELVRRPDDDRPTFLRRLARQRQGAVELLAHYEARGVLVRVDGTRPPAEVAQALLEAARTAPDAAQLKGDPENTAKVAG
ncbi:adenylate kinase [Paractinoplanes ferrugineus]|uniref:Adenylate kinase n=1 Tax=Paractinoplanes ferrugineus TaxID=113564 RepID=A0A919J8E4_9ACTN|nr:nucleoside monophosphate kinase [Actinoplanes ferrugineus]GIE15464.1 adenylate kinase [Actinoplanes ferrugineus]